MKLYLYEVWSGRFSEIWYEVHSKKIKDPADTYKLIEEFKIEGDKIIGLLLNGRIEAP